jgi:hypothetical protein
MESQAPPAPVQVDQDTLRTEIPTAMQTARRWLVWKAIPQAGKKPRKVPYYLDGTERRGTLDSPEDQARLGTFADALSVLESGRYAGLGFALGPDGTGTHWQGIDLDHTDTRPELAALVEQLPGYVEWSPSGTGVHAIGYGAGFQALGSNASGIEAYAAGRFFTVTAEAIGGDIEDLSGFVTGTLAPLHRPAANSPGQHDTPVESVTPGQVAELRSALLHMRADDRELWVRMGHALKGLGDTGRGLWLDWSATSEKFNAADASRTWESFRPERTDYRAVFAEAQRHGWVNPMAGTAPDRANAPQGAPAPGAMANPPGQPAGASGAGQAGSGTLSDGEAQELIAYLSRTGRKAPKWGGWPESPMGVGKWGRFASIAADHGLDGFMVGVEKWLPNRAAIFERIYQEAIAKGRTPPKPDIPEDMIREHAAAWLAGVQSMDVTDERGRELLARLPRKAIGLTPVGKLLDPPPPLRWLVKGYLLPASMILVFGASAAGKSLVALSWAVSVSCDLDWCGRKVTPGPVVYLAGEGHFGISRRLKALALHLECEAKLRDAPLFVSSRGAALTDTAALEGVADEIDGIAEEAGTPALIVIDTLHRNFGSGDENSAADMGAFIAAGDFLRERYQGATVLIVHHSGHGEKGRARGSSSLRAAVDIEFALEHDEGTGTRTLTPGKHKDMPKPQDAAFDLEVITLPWMTDDGDPEESVVLVPCTGSGKPRKTATPALRLAFEALLCAMDERGIEPPDHWKHPTAKPERVVTLNDWRGAHHARHTGGTQGAKDQALLRARKELNEQGAVGCWCDTYFPIPRGGPWSDLHDMLTTRPILHACLASLEAAREAA